MGNVANTVEFRQGGTPAPVSRGAKTLKTIVGTCTFSNSYATGGDTLTVPTGEGTLVSATVSPAADGTRIYAWNGNTSTPKLKAYSAIATEVTAATDLSAAGPFQVTLIFEQ